MFHHYVQLEESSDKRRFFFSTLFSVLEILMKHTISCLIYYIPKINMIGSPVRDTNAYAVDFLIRTAQQAKTINMVSILC